MIKIAKIQNFDIHSLKVVSGNYIPTDWLFFDSETKIKEENCIKNHYFDMGWSCYWNRWSNHWSGLEDWKYWTNEKKFNEYLQRLVNRLGRLILCGHNIFFDLQACGFFKYFTEWGWTLDFVYDKGLTYILRCKKDKNVLTVLSTTNYFDSSLKKLGEVIGLEKLDVDFEKSSRKEMKVYCHRDVEIILESMKYYISFLRRHKLGSLGLTKSSQSFTAYRHRFMFHKLTIHKEAVVTTLERSAYIGGRTECFRIGQQKGKGFVSLDINSMYPYVMKNNLYPWELVSYNSHMDLKSYKDILKKYAVIAKVVIKTSEAAFAVKYNKKTVFPVGKFECDLCTRGFQYAFEHGYIKEIKEVAIYRQANLFSQFVTYFYRLRYKYKDENNKVMELLCKYILNSLYGKFGAKGIVRDEYEEFTGRDYFKEEVLNIDTGIYTIIIKLMNKLIFMRPDIEGDNSFPGLAAHITEDARMVLWSLIKSIGCDKVLYCDTDSVKIRKSHLKHVKWQMNSIELGALKIEDESNKLYLGGAKNYRTENSRTIKGIPKRAKETSPGVFEFETFGRQNIHLRSGQLSGVQMFKTTRRLDKIYDKGIVHDNGEITPLVF